MRPVPTKTTLAFWLLSDMPLLLVVVVMVLAVNMPCRVLDGAAAAGVAAMPQELPGLPR